MLGIDAQIAGAGLDPGDAGLLVPLVVLLFAVCVTALLMPLIGLVVTGSRAALRRWRRRRHSTSVTAHAESRARALMSELCPNGWRAQITLFGHSDETPGRPQGPRGRVALDWAELQDPGGRPAVVRRVWAPTIADALEAMIADRRTDETLERIEQGAVAEGARWPDL